MYATDAIPLSKSSVKISIVVLNVPLEKSTVYMTMTILTI